MNPKYCNPKVLHKQADKLEAIAIDVDKLTAQRDALIEACKEARYYAGLARDEFRAGTSPIATLDWLTAKVKAALALCEPKEGEKV